VCNNLFLSPVISAWRACHYPHHKVLIAITLQPVQADLGLEFVRSNPVSTGLARLKQRLCYTRYSKYAPRDNSSKAVLATSISLLKPLDRGTRILCPLRHCLVPQYWRPATASRVTGAVWSTPVGFPVLIFPHGPSSSPLPWRRKFGVVAVPVTKFGLFRP
jgi:hypothetical protein